MSLSSCDFSRSFGLLRRSVGMEGWREGRRKGGKEGGEKEGG